MSTLVLKNFRSYQLAVAFYHQCHSVRAPSYLKTQLMRAASSVVLNLSEGSAKPTEADRRRFYAIALGSQRECASIFDLLPHTPLSVRQSVDQLGACLYRLCHPK